MPKVVKPASNSVFPVPVVLVTSIDGAGRPNIITLAWVSNVCSNPPQVGISVQPIRYSHGLITESGEFVVNIPSASLARQVDVCGFVSGKDVDKFAKTGLTPAQAQQVKPPLIEECPVNIECRVKHRITLGSHDLFIGEVLCVQADEDVLVDGKIDIAKVNPISYNLREYWTLQEQIGFYAFSVKPRGETDAS